MILLCDIGNTHTHLGLADRRRVKKAADFPTREWSEGNPSRRISEFAGVSPLEGTAVCSVVPAAVQQARALLAASWNLVFLELNHRTVRGVGVNYPRPQTIGPDRLANAIAARHFFGSPCVAVDFGTAVTFDVVDRHGDFVGGIIAPGLGLMTDYLHEKTALLPRVNAGSVRAAIGKSTEQAIMIGAVWGLRGLTREMVVRIRRQMRCRKLPVVGTGAYARLIAVEAPEITALKPRLTLEGLRLFWEAYRADLLTASSSQKGDGSE